MLELDVIADLNAEDDDGLRWSTLSDEHDADRVRRYGRPSKTSSDQHHLGRSRCGHDDHNGALTVGPTPAGHTPVDRRFDNLTVAGRTCVHPGRWDTRLCRPTAPLRLNSVSRCGTTAPELNAP